ncbi:uncharacterized protein LOC124135592 isoform X2 [Haliotis rufescens]|uniref:uncharacterized protein LOC124135592 isoform X2 n=1 Tax=Haliotis rufescens TaxID=6454 RepID=UPI001EB076D5|nr:uncharacterized protein LOC124135592 isoform X2 [Haliotis rufescens]
MVGDKLWLLGLLVHLSLGSSAPDEVPDAPQLKSTCPKGWTQDGRNCFTVNEETVDFRGAAVACNGSVGSIRNMEQNIILKGIIKEPTWIHVQYISDYGWVEPGEHASLNFSNPKETINRSGLYKCGLLTPEGTWELDDCRGSEHPSLCQRSLECEDGWFGDKCMDRCHCFTPGCNSSSGECSHGCKVGWTGPSCNIRQKKTEARYHCMRDGEDQYHMILKVDNHGINFRSVNALTPDGSISQTCSKANFTINEDGPMLTYIHGNDTQFSPDCSAQKVDDTDPVYEWTFRLQQVDGVLSPYDTDVKVRCNFTDADKMIISTPPVHVKRKTQPREEIAPNHVSTNVVIVDAKSGEEVSHVALGQEIQMEVPVPQQNSTDDRSVIGLLSPRNCEAKSPDGQFVKKITDSEGCDVFGSKSGEFTLKGQEGEERRMRSNAFSAFAFSGYSSLIFSCDLKPCYNPILQNCISPCRRGRRYGRSSDDP